LTETYHAATVRHVTLRDALRRLRADAGGLTQAQAALRVGVPRETWNKWESGKRSLNPDSARKLEQEFRLPDRTLDRYVNPARSTDGEAAAHLADALAQLQQLLERQADLERRESAALERITPLLERQGRLVDDLRGLVDQLLQRESGQQP
jgi:transcriptional regulator with XRE-family HTH domain